MFYQATGSGEKTECLKLGGEKMADNACNLGILPKRVKNKNDWIWREVKIDKNLMEEARLDDEIGFTMGVKYLRKLK